MDENRTLFERFFAVQREYVEYIRRQPGVEHVHPRQAPILGLLLQTEGMSQTELAHRLEVSAATVAVSVARLEKLDFVAREKDLHHQRVNRLRLTQQGRVEAERLQAVVEGACCKALRGFSQSEIEWLLQVSERIADNLKGNE